MKIAKEIEDDRTRREHETLRLSKWPPSALPGWPTMRHRRR